MQNPFESGHIKNYILLYVSVVVIMVLFFIASTLFNDVEVVERKVFPTEIVDKNISKISDINEESKNLKFKLMSKTY
ncbi:MAG: hypothetical protein J7J96_04840 [Sulfurimonas sp.]|nr:hypothetical protein [Sulfurimonas sp.]